MEYDPNDGYLASGKRNGIKNLKMGKETFSLIAVPEKGVVEVTASKDFTLVLFDSKIECKSGRQLLSCKNFRTKGL